MSVEIQTMSAAEARACVDQIKFGMENIRSLVLDLYERRGWVPLGYSNWRECVVAEFGHSQRSLYNALTAGRTERVLQNSAKDVPESQLLALAQAGEPEDVREVWAVVSASDEPVTAKKIEQAVTEHKRQKTRVEWACRTCGEVFAHPVWHCETCDEHWPMDVRTCPDCSPEPSTTDAPEPVPPTVIEPSRQVEALQRGLTALRDAARLGATDGMVTNRTNSLIRDLERLIVDARRARGELV